MKKLSPEELKTLTRPTFKRSDQIHFRLQATDQQRENLYKLADYLWQLPPDYDHFEMATWVSNYYHPRHTTSQVINRCGFAACAAGHGPAAGIKPQSLQAESEWNAYVSESFSESAKAIDFLFGGCWSDSDNTVKGAASRIYYALQHGIPADYYEQIEGEAPLCYTEME